MKCSKTLRKANLKTCKELCLMPCDDMKAETVIKLQDRMDKKINKFLPNLKDDCFNFQVDYKPWDNDLTPQDYASYGFEQGQRQLIKKLINKGILK